MIKEKIHIISFFLFILVLLGCSSSKITQNNENDYDKKYDYDYESDYSSDYEYLDETEDGYDYQDEYSTYAKDYVIRGSILEQQKNYASAILDYFEALKYDSSASIMWAIAKCYKNLNRMETAIDWAINSYRKDTTFSPTIKLLADLYFLQFNYEKATLYYEKLAQQKPNISNRVRLAIIYEFNRPHNAIEIYESIIQDGEDIAILKRLLDLYKRVNDNENYLRIAEKLFNYAPYNNLNAFDLIEALILNKNYEKAFSLLEKLELSLSMNDYNSLLQYLASVLLTDTLNVNKRYVEIYLEKINNKRRFEWKVQLLSAYLAHSIGDTIKSENFIFQTLKIADSIKDVPLEVSFFYSYTKQNQKAIEILSKYENSFPNDYRYPFYIAVGYSILKRYDSCLNPLYRCLKINDSSLEVWSQIGIVYDQLGMIDSSDYAYEKALEISPFDALVNNNYAYSLSVRGINLEKALEMIKISLRYEPFNPSYLDTYAWIQFKLNNLEEALTYIDKAISNGGFKSAEVWEHKGDILEKMGSIKEAYTAWQKALEIEPDRYSVAEKIKRYKK